MLPEPSSSVFHLVEAQPWLRLSPPIVAITLAILFKDVNFALLLATFCGCLLLPGSAVGSFCDVLVDQIASTDHASVILFTVLLGAMISVMNDSGGTRAIVERLTRYADTRPKGQILTWLAGLVVFFDDYANTMLVGGSMRPLCDKLRFSRAKLAFLIDATAAPVAGLALSTWTAYEINLVADGLAAENIQADAGRIFFATLPYRLYPWLAILTVGMIAWSGRDFGAMLRAEEKALSAEAPPAGSTGATTGKVAFAVLPVVVLVAVVAVGYLRGNEVYRLLLLASLAAAIAAVLLPLLTRHMTVSECSQSWTAGVTSMVPAVIVLILAWALADVCGPDQRNANGDTEHRLNTADFIVSLVGDSVRPEFLPSIAFIAAGAIAVSIGSSFTTMALLVPMFMRLSWSLLAQEPAAEVSPDDPIFLATVGAILAGAIFGDHCSPISDTTVLSSAAAGCDHLEHVATQFPYAMLVALCSLLFGYLPIGFGVPWWIALPVSAVACVGGIRLLGKQPGQRSAAEKI